VSTIIPPRADPKRPSRASPLNRHIAAAPLLDAVDRAGIPPRSMPVGIERALDRARITGWLTVKAADQLACELLHEHPALIYGQNWYEIQS
jgi:hypothetical protein